MVVEIPDTDYIDMSNPHFNKIDVSRRRLVAKVVPVKKKGRKPPAGTKIQVIGVFFDKKNHPKGFKGRENQGRLKYCLLTFVAPISTSSSSIFDIDRDASTTDV